MGPFNRNKTNNNAEERDSFVDSVRDFKRNIINKTGVNQQGFYFIEKPYNKRNNKVLGTKKGLRFNFEKIENNHIDILKKCKPENTAVELMKILKRTNKSKFKTGILNPLIESGFFELTIPETPSNPKQKYRLTGKFVRRILKTL